ncbi:hypothetical protein ABZP36_010643 [Zizania latifolia]
MIFSLHSIDIYLVLPFCYISQRNLIKLVIMEHFRRGVEFGMASTQRCNSLSCKMAESPQIDVRKAAIPCKEKSRRSKCCHPADMPIIPEQAIEFLSRTWSPSSSDLFQVFSRNSLGTSSEDHQPEKASKDEEEIEEKDEGEGEERHLSTVRFGEVKSQFFNQTWCVLASEKPSPIQHKHKLKQPTWLNVGHIKAILQGHFLNGVSVTRSQRKKRREELRLQAAQAHAAVSVAQLAAAITGIVSVCELRHANVSCVEAADGKRMGMVLASAAALIATICAEAAETAGANRSRVMSAVKTGLGSCSSAELLTLTATAATCLRGAATLKLRADVRGISSSNSVAISTTSIQKGTTQDLSALWERAGEDGRRLPSAQHSGAEAGEAASVRGILNLQGL